MAVALSMFLKIMYAPPPSVSMTILSVLSATLLGLLGLLEIMGKNLQYSKFENVMISQKNVDSRIDMLSFYTPPFLAALTSFVLLPNQDFRFLLLKSALAIHFFKRNFEVLYVHKYSGRMSVDTMIKISPFYFIGTTTMIYAQHLTQGLLEPEMDLKYHGIVLFLIGISGNFYHHYLLSKLRRENEKVYKIPKGGLFNLVICPHYLFEILGFLGLSLISQTACVFSATIGVIFFLAGRSYATRRWYLTKFEDFPKNVKALVPFVF